VKLDTEALLQALRRADPEGAQMMDALAQRVERHAGAADAAGDIPSAFWDGAPVEKMNRLNLPAGYGGQAFSATALRRAVTFERISRICLALPMSMPGPGLSMPPVLSLGTPAQRSAYFGRFVGQERPVWGAFAITEPQGGSDATHMRTVARRQGDRYVLDGEKCFITNGARADVVIVFATLDPAKGRFGVRAFIVPRGTAGFCVVRSEDMMGLRASQLSTLSFTDCEVPAEHMLGHTGKRGPLVDAFTGAQDAWDYMRPALAAGINGSCFGVLGHARRCLVAGESCLPRARLGAACEVLDQYMARTRAAQLLALRAAWKYDRGERSSLDASMAKACSATLAMDLAHRLAALLPLQAASNGNPLEKFVRDAKAYDILEGTGDMQRLMIARAADDEALSTSSIHFQRNGHESPHGGR
jgi:acyl-CoA dehydrogenase